MPGAGGSLRTVRQRHHGGHGLRRARGEGGRDLAGYVYSLLSANDSGTLHLALAMLLFATSLLKKSMEMGRDGRDFSQIMTFTVLLLRLASSLQLKLNCALDFSSMPS